MQAEEQVDKRPLLARPIIMKKKTKKKHAGGRTGRLAMSRLDNIFFFQLKVAKDRKKGDKIVNDR